MEDDGEDEFHDIDATVSDFEQLDSGVTDGRRMEKSRNPCVLYRMYCFSSNKQVLQVIYMIFTSYVHALHGMYMISSMLFVFCICRATYLAENQKSLVEI